MKNTIMYIVRNKKYNLTGGNFLFNASSVMKDFHSIKLQVNARISLFWSRVEDDIEVTDEILLIFYFGIIFIYNFF